MEGDCLELMKAIPSNSIDCVLTDPPYILTGGGRGKGAPVGGVFGKHNEGMKSGKVFKHNIVRFEEWLGEVYRVMKPTTHALIFINNRNILDLYNEAMKHFKFKNIITWDKIYKNPSRSYMIQTEFILMLGKGWCRGINDMGDSNLVRFSNRIKNKTHPTQKPVELLEYLVKNSSNAGDTVLDIFMGSGSTGVACKNLNRNFIGIEQDEKYFKIAEDRING